MAIVFCFSADAPEETRTLFNTVVDNFRNFVDVNAKVIEAVSAGRLEEASKISGAVSSKYRTQLMKDLATLVDKEVASGEEAGAIAQSGYDKALYTFCGYS